MPKFIIQIVTATKLQWDKTNGVQTNFKIQSFRQTVDVKKIFFTKNLQVFKDEIVFQKPEDDFDEMLKISYNRKPNWQR